MKNILLGIAMTLFSFILTAQNHPFDNYNYSDEEIEIPSQFSEKDEIVLFRNRTVQIISTGDNVEQYFMLHEKILVNSDDAIEKNNRIYIAISQNEKILVNKNRVILPDSSVTELDDEDILIEEDTESGSSYEYYAVKGLVKGAIIEKVYITQENPYFRGTSYTFQGSAPVLSSNFKLIYPKHLEFKHKSYSGLKEPVYTDSIGSENTQMLEIDVKNIEAANFDETLANPRNHLQKFRYKLYRNKASGAKNFYNYSEFATKFFEGLDLERTKKEKKALAKFLGQIEQTADPAEKLLNLESHIKENIVFNASFGDNGDLTDIVKNKQANIRDLLELYTESFLYEDIKAEIVFTSNRFSRVFDTEFETTDNLQEILFYIPELKQYLDPKDATLRSPLFNYNYGTNHGMRIKEKEFGGAIMAVAVVEEIPIPDMLITTDTMYIAVDMSEDVGNPSVESDIVFGGYSGANFQAIKDYVPDDRYKEIMEDIAKNYAADVELDKLEVRNDGQKFIGRAPFTLDIDFQAEDLMQKTGKKYLFKMGELIGRQSQIYQEEERQFPVEISYPHNYYREINITLPEGYSVANLDVLEMDFEAVIDGEKQAIFKSVYEIQGNNLKITNYEYYKIVHYPLEYFKAYQSVLNAAADFNKIVLVLQKEE